MLRKSFYRVLFLVLVFLVILTGCRGYDGKLDIAYFLKTEPEKAILDFFYSLNSKDPDYIYTNLLPESDKNNISREKYVAEFEKILSDVESIEVKEIVYLGFENDMSKVVAEFEVSYKNGELKKYKKYIYLTEEEDKWKILFEKTFI